ncbi:Ctr copper transporter family-domain-containing protein [Fimicolochytrium jonesii]|uniref:Ctr copper transporter family-domain-containing protein n=1 Tax=Fimicolochytrium jonesii TaxID=1396493 RepID=UPI0022FED2C0|nr:Ctr copper transporter family-domain-containing protein [Fimicolochytrium jonesii]KAI8819223.1 Ctr copper transporter family-domain-containing protein [Fimicolochytrium jonesii]
MSPSQKKSFLLLALGAGTLSLSVAAQDCPAPPASCPRPTNPADPACASFRLCDKNATAAMDSLCTQMDAMPGCNLRKLCTTSPGSVPEPYCKPMSLLADVCSVDMPRMSDCATYVNMCGNSTSASTSVNAQCKEPASAALPNIPTSKAATQNIYSICHEMSMPGCEACSITSATDTYPRGSCDLMGTYALLCKAMPDMRQCADWKTMCAATPNLGWCSSANGGDANSNDPPIMRMFFHTGFVDYVLFETWIPRTSGQYFGTWLAVFLLGIFYEAWNTFVATYESKLLQRHKATDTVSKTGLVPPNTASPIARPTQQGNVVQRIQRAVVRGLAKFVTVTVAYALMLVAMTFNVGLFFAVVLGLAIGSAIFSEWTRAAVAAAVMDQAGGEELCC